MEKLRDEDGIKMMLQTILSCEKTDLNRAEIIFDYLKVLLSDNYKDWEKSYLVNNLVHQIESISGYDYVYLVHCSKDHEQIEWIEAVFRKREDAVQFCNKFNNEIQKLANKILPEEVDGEGYLIEDELWHKIHNARTYSEAKILQYKLQ